MGAFCIYGVAAIIQRNIGNEKCILIQDREKGPDSIDTGLIEVPCCRVKTGISVFKCIRNNVLDETGLTVTKIYGEGYLDNVKYKDYEVINYIPFFSTHNIGHNYPIIIETFICEAQGEALKESYDASNIRWITLIELSNMLTNDESIFYPMIVMPLKHYLNKNFDLLVS